MRQNGDQPFYESSFSHAGPCRARVGAFLIGLLLNKPLWMNFSRSPRLRGGLYAQQKPIRLVLTGEHAISIAYVRGVLVVSTAAPYGGMRKDSLECRNRSISSV